MKRSKRMQLVVDLAIKAENQAARNLKESTTIAEGEARRADEINTYYKSYEKQFSEKTTQLHASELATIRGFLTNLDQACKAQALQVEKAWQQVDVARSQWHASHLKVDSLSSYQTQCQQQEQAEVDRLEQKQLDELAAQRIQRQSQSPS